MNKIIRMTINRQLWTLMILLNAGYLFAQDSLKLTLSDCYKKAIENHPLSRQNDLYRQASVLQLSNLDKNHLPQVNINGQASYQSAVTNIPIRIPGINVPTLPLDQYKLSLDLNQLIYDGGLLKFQKELEKNNLLINQQNTEIELFTIKERINQVYFAILLTDENLDLLSNTKKDLETRRKTLESGVQNGVMLRSNVDILQSEILNVNQKIIEAQYQREGLINILSELLSTPLPQAVHLQTPGISMTTLNQKINRPEYLLFDIQKQGLDVSKKMSGLKTIPRVSGFGTMGYGQPGLDMFKDGFAFYYMIGARVSWNLWNWNQTNQELRIADLKKNIVENQYEAFDKNIKAQAWQYESDISKVRSLIASDDELIKLRENISRSAASQLEHGVITSTEYLTEFDREIQAKLSQKLHKVQLVQAQANLMATYGNF